MAAHQVDGIYPLGHDKGGDLLIMGGDMDGHAAKLGRVKPQLDGLFFCFAYKVRQLGRDLRGHGRRRGRLVRGRAHAMRCSNHLPLDFEAES